MGAGHGRPSWGYPSCRSHLGNPLLIWSAYLGIFIGLFACVHAVDMIVFSFPIGRDRTNTLW